MTPTTHHDALLPTYDVVVIGGGPAGATAAQLIAARGHSVLLLDRGGRVKPCGGAIPPRLIRDFAIPDELLVAKARCARMVAPSKHRVDIPIENGFVGMVDRHRFDPWLRARAVAAGAQLRKGTFESIEQDDDGGCVVHFKQRDDARQAEPDATSVRARGHRRRRCALGGGSPGGAARP
jgi:geranylgeranyl diphosphate/geranylgeranyl-bacteriochlorophyllide a reductase